MAVTSAPQAMPPQHLWGPKNKECTSQDGTMDDSEPLEQFYNQFLLNHVKYFILSCNVC